MEIRKFSRIVSTLCFFGIVYYFSGCSTPSALKTGMENGVKSLVYKAKNPSMDEGVLIGGIMYGGEAAIGLVGGYLLGEFLYQTLTAASAPSSSDGPKPLNERYTRQIEAQYLARLDSDRQVIEDTNSTEWMGALYYAIRKETRNVKDSDFDSSAYAVDLDAGTVDILDTAFEAEPFTGTVIVSNKVQRLVAYINKGIMVETGSLRDSNGTKILHNEYNEHGTLRESSKFDENGTLQLKDIYDENGTFWRAHSYDVNGIKRITKIYDENGSWKEDYTYYDNGVVSLKRILDEDGFIEDLRFDKNGKRVLRRADLIFVSDVRIRFQKLNRYTNPTQDSVMKIYDKHELANNPNQPFAFTGTVVEFYDQKYLIKKRQEEIKEGFYDGTSNWWYKNGGKQFEATFKKGVPQGKVSWWREDGSLEYEGEWEEDKLILAKTFDTAGDPIGVGVIGGNGTLTYFHSNGNKRMEETYIDGKLDPNNIPKFFDVNGRPMSSVEARFIPNYRRRID